MLSVLLLLLCCFYYSYKSGNSSKVRVLVPVEKFVVSLLAELGWQYPVVSEPVRASQSIHTRGSEQAGRDGADRRPVVLIL